MTIAGSMKRLTIAIVAVAALSITSWLLLVSFGFFEGDLTGSVFIVTRGGQNVKLGLVEVRAIPEQEILSFIQEKQAVAKKEQDELQPLVEEAEQQAQEAEEEYKEVDDQYKKMEAEADAAFRDFLGLWGTQLEQQKKVLDTARERAKAALEARKAKTPAMTAKSRALSKLKVEYSHWTSNTYYFDGLPVGLASTKTDADGAFSLRLRRGVKYALAAKARREVMDDTEAYYWLVWVTLDGNQTKIFLSNDNLRSGACTPVSCRSPSGH